jgi:hypothetical protein
MDVFLKKKNKFMFIIIVNFINKLSQRICLYPVSTSIKPIERYPAKKRREGLGALGK